MTQEEEKSNLSLRVMDLVETFAFEPKEISLNVLMMAYCALHSAYGFTRENAHALVDSTWDAFGSLGIRIEDIQRKIRTRKVN